MDRIIEYRVQPGDISLTSGGLLGKILNLRMGLTSHEISHAKFTPGGITVLRAADSTDMQAAGISVSRMGDATDAREDDATPLPEPVTVNTRAQAGDLVRILFADSAEEGGEKVPPAKGALSILYEDEDVVVLNKPAGLVSHPAHGHHKDTLANYLAGYYESKGLTGKLRVVGRLDKDTSGVILFAKNAPAAARLFRQKETGIFRKAYLAVAEGTELAAAAEHYGNEAAGCGISAAGNRAAADPAALHVSDECNGNEDTAWSRIRLPLGPVPGTLAKQQVCEPPAGKPALTRFLCLGEAKGCSLVKAEIDTGRTHQIRVHFSAIGHPLVGDPLYGTPCGGTKRALLHAHQVVFLQPFTGKRIRLTAPLPKDMAEYFL